MLKRYYHQNTYVEDFWEVAMLFYNRLKDFLYGSITHITGSLAQLSQIIVNPHYCMIAGNNYHMMTRVSREKR